MEPYQVLSVFKNSTIWCMLSIFLIVALKALKILPFVHLYLAIGVQIIAKTIGDSYVLHSVFGNFTVRTFGASGSPSP